MKEVLAIRETLMCDFALGVGDAIDSMNMARIFFAHYKVSVIGALFAKVFPFDPRCHVIHFFNPVLRCESTVNVTHLKIVSNMSPFILSVTRRSPNSSALI